MFTCVGWTSSEAFSPLNATFLSIDWTDFGSRSFASMESTSSNCKAHRYRKEVIWKTVSFFFVQLDQSSDWKGKEISISGSRKWIQRVSIYCSLLSNGSNGYGTFKAALKIPGSQKWTIRISLHEELMQKGQIWKMKQVPISIMPKFPGVWKIKGIGTEMRCVIKLRTVPSLLQ